MQSRIRSRDPPPRTRHRRDQYGPGPRGGFFRHGNGFRQNTGNPLYKPREAYSPAPPLPPHPPAPLRKIDILMEAGRLAAEYLLHKGVLIPSLLPARAVGPPAWSGEGEDESKRRVSGVSVLDRIGCESSDMGSGRRTYDEDFNYKMTRRRKRGVGQYDEGDGSDWGKENCRSWSRNERSRGVDDRRYGSDKGDLTPRHSGRSRNFTDNRCGEDGDDFPMGQRQGSISDDHGLNSLKADDDSELPSKSEVIGESELVISNCDLQDDTHSKARSPSAAKISAPKSDVNLNDEPGEVQIRDMEIGEVEVEDDVCGVGRKPEKNEDSPVPHNSAEMKHLSELDSDSLSFCGFMKVPRKHRTPVARRTMNVVRHNSEKGKTCDSEEIEKSKMAYDNIAMSEKEGHVQDSFANTSFDLRAGTEVNLNYSAGETSQVQYAGADSAPLHPNTVLATGNKAYKCAISFIGVSMSSSLQIDDEIYNKLLLARENSLQTHQIESSEILPASDIIIANSDMRMDHNLIAGDIINKRKRSTDSSSSVCSQSIQQCSLAAKEKPEVSAQKNIVDMESFQKIDAESKMKLQQEKQVLPNSFNFFDLNLIETSEIAEISDNSILDDIPGSMAAAVVENVSTMDFNMSEAPTQNNTAFYIQQPSDNKLIPIINLEDDDSSAEDGACDLPKPKNETMYSTLENFLSRTEPIVDLPDNQGEYNLAISDFLGADITSCPPVPAGIHSPQPGVALNGAEEIPVDDDSIYVSLGEIPIDFMDVWDPPPQYGKYF